MTFVIKFNGRSSSVGGGSMRADYECPTHGRFELLVERDTNGDPPGDAACPYRETYPRPTGVSSAYSAAPPVRVGSSRPCPDRCPWRVSMPAVHTQFVVSATQGKSAPKPHREAMDTRPLAEGRKNEWRKERKRLKEERRHKRIKEFLR